MMKISILRATAEGVDLQQRVSSVVQLLQDNGQVGITLPSVTLTQGVTLHIKSACAPLALRPIALRGWVVS